MTRLRAAVPIALTCIGAAVLTGCATAIEGRATVDAAEVSAALALPAGRGTPPADTDRRGFTAASARCDGTDVPVTLISGGLPADPYRFAVCRDDSGMRYLRAWANGEPSSIDSSPPRITFRGSFLTDTPNSAQFLAGDAKVDIGPTVVTITWPRRGSTTWTTTYPIRARWDRL
ncbi:hypothetical protein AXK56_03420 [Tsukamurella pulmonis]|uniref:Lipoprotein n=1 Tax=Tsukamurella pulmonis TaxID=47312 RepID=A0A1H1DZW6_9ACTN|nr:hypothetical protein [Tsukamurella pulmonis]KXO92154.1 hypothetical protein AXK56_03420 [Tsukamurella pulmonis]SDQ81426.1 hypothetical protein SAMN04489765_1948 [Tsukamurella pulmonis]SUP21529.1 Uncharacterised protein [Tsukamurella pulmonis]